MGNDPVNKFDPSGTTAWPKDDPFSCYPFCTDQQRERASQNKRFTEMSLSGGGGGSPNSSSESSSKNSSSEDGGGFGNAILDLVGKVWAAPATVLGLAYGGLSYGIGWVGYGLGLNDAPRVRIDNNAIEFINSPLIFSSKALTLGNTILYGRNAPPWENGAYGDQDVNIGLHERAHTYQYQVLGLLFVPAYLLGGGFSGPDGNVFEGAAQAYGKGSGHWWPK